MKLFTFLLAVLMGVAPSSADVLSLEQRVVEHTCPNGIKLLILERHFSPTVSIRMMFRTGAVDETSGRTGLAHMFEHMMFKGTHTLGTQDYAAEAPLLKQIDSLHHELDQEKSKGEKINQTRVSQLIDSLQRVEAKASALIHENELMDLYEREGGSRLNAATSADYTEYMVNLPANKLALWAILDSDRIRNPVFRQFYQERNIVLEERRLRVDNSPEGKLYENLLTMAYQAHPYHHPTIGWASDVEHLTVEDLRSFYQENYIPSRLTISIVGDVQSRDVIALVDRTFGGWKAPAPRYSHFITEEPRLEGPRRVVVQADAQSKILLCFRIPAYPNPDHPLYAAVTQLLASGHTSRLYKSLVEKKRLAVSVDAGEDYPGQRYDSLLILSISPRFPHTVEEIERAVWEELNRLKQQPIEPWELRKIRAAMEMELLSNLQTNDGMAYTLVYHQSIFGNWRALLEFQHRLETVTANDLQQLAQRTFLPNRQVVAVLEPKKP